MQNKKETAIQTAKKKLTYYFTKANKNFPKNKTEILALAKEELRILFGRN